MRFTTTWIALTIIVAAVGFEWKGLAGMFALSLVMAANYGLFWFVVLGIERVAAPWLRQRSGGC